MTSLIVYQHLVAWVLRHCVNLKSSYMKGILQAWIAQIVGKSLITDLYSIMCIYKWYTCTVDGNINFTLWVIIAFKKQWKKRRSTVPIVRVCLPLTCSPALSLLSLAGLPPFTQLYLHCTLFLSVLPVAVSVPASTLSLSKSSTVVHCWVSQGNILKRERSDVI